jgi:hypothetical protein
MTEVPGWTNEVHPAIRSLVDLVGDRLTQMTTAEGYPQVRQLAAAYLARVRRLTVAMDVLYEAEMPDVVGGLLRICFESWVTGMWVLLVGQDAVDMLLAHHVKTSNKLIEGAGLDVELLDEVEDATQIPNMADRTKVVEKFLVAEGDGSDDELQWSYRLVYGGESAAGVHAGFASVAGHLDPQPAWTAIRLSRVESGDGSGKLLWAAPLLAMLARRVFLAFDYSTDVLDETAEPIRKVAVRLNEEAAAQANGEKVNEAT